MTRDYAEHYVTRLLLWAMRDCRELGRSFNDCLAAAGRSLPKRAANAQTQCH